MITLSIDQTIRLVLERGVDVRLVDAQLRYWGPRLAPGDPFTVALAVHRDELTRADGVGGLQRFDVGHSLDQGHRSRGDLAQRADHLGMTLMADEKDMPARGDQPFGLAMYL